MDSSQAITALKGVGEARKKLLNKLGIYTIDDALYHLPREYMDLSSPDSLAQARHGNTAIIYAKVLSPAQTSYIRGKMNITTVKIVSDGIPGVCVWYNQPFLRGMFNPGTEWIFFGKVDSRYGDKRLISPGYEPLLPGIAPGILPVYPLTTGISQKTIRSVISTALESCPDPEDVLPETVIRQNNLLPLKDALMQAHFPRSLADAARARESIFFGELLLFILFLRERGIRQRKERTNGRLLCLDEDRKRWEEALPYPLTNAQKRVIGEIIADLRGDAPMNRLVQGDVGCGKTAIAFEALYLCAVEGRQCAMMAPTELLAKQHYEQALSFFEPLGISVELLTGSMGAAAHRAALRRIAQGDCEVVIGTHALIQDQVNFRDLALVVTDEQHRFGVLQRSQLSAKGKAPHVLVMSATPVPRTLALLLYADLDLSIVDELPPGRMPVKTHIVPEARRTGLYQYLAAQLRQGARAYIVCPRIEETDNSDLASAESIYDELRRGILKDYPLALVHSRMNAEEKEACVASFRRGETKALVCTTVIEVGMNVPDATVMIIENAERFGLSQLHQLRGRVGRGSQQAWCFLVNAGNEENERLKALCTSQDGFEVAQADLDQRGPGEFLGTRQAGMMDPTALRLLKDTRLIKKVEDTCSQLRTEPDLTPAYEALRAQAEKRYGLKADIVFN